MTSAIQDMSSIELLSPTGQLRLARPSPTEDAAVLQNRTHPGTRKYLKFLPEHLTIDEARQLRESRARDSTMVDFNIHLITDKELGTEAFAGTTACFNINETFKSCEVGILIVPQLLRGGIATEAIYTVLRWIFEEKQFHRVTFETGIDNLPMQRWLEDVAGAKLEALRRECWRNVDGTYTDVRGYSILDLEWNESVKSRLEARLGSKDRIRKSGYQYRLKIREFKADLRLLQYME
jgi:RimJ/RimL family protein N-acetyltransferase